MSSLSSYDYVRSHRRRKKTHLIGYLGGSCVLCDYSKCERALEAHHVDEETKEFSISQSLNRAWGHIKKELKKCILLCANCHREVHEGMHSEVDFQKILGEDLLRRESFPPFIARPGKKTYKCPDCGLPRSRQAARCRDCHYKARTVATWPDNSVLLQEYKALGGSATGRKYGVTGNAVRKRLKRRGLL